MFCRGGERSAGPGEAETGLGDPKRLLGAVFDKLAKIMDHVRLFVRVLLSGQTDLAHTVDADDLHQQLFAFLNDVADVAHMAAIQLTYVHQSVGAGQDPTKAPNSTMRRTVPM